MIGSTLLLLAIYALLALPALIVFRLRRHFAAAGAFYVLVGVAVLTLYVGSPLASRRPDFAEAAIAGAGTPSPDRCAHVLEVSERGRIIRNRSNPARLVVDPVLWAQLPEQARTVLVTCAESMRGTAGGGTVEVVNQSGG